MIVDKVKIICRGGREFTFETVDGKEIDIDNFDDCYWVKLDGITRSFPCANVIMVETQDEPSV